MGDERGTEKGHRVGLRILRWKGKPIVKLVKEGDRNRQVSTGYGVEIP